jgi:hypothetical protein
MVASGKRQHNANSFLSFESKQEREGRERTQFFSLKKKIKTSSSSNRRVLSDSIPVWMKIQKE